MPIITFLNVEERHVECIALSLRSFLCAAGQLRITALITKLGQLLRVFNAYCIYNELRRFDAIFLGLPERKFLACTVHVKDRHSMCDSFNIKILNYLHQK